MKFQNNLRNIRLERGLTQLKLADGLGTSQSAIAAWESGAREPDFRTIQRIADYFNVPMSALLPSDDYAEDERITRIVDAMHKDEKLCLLFDAQRTLKQEDIAAVFAVVKAIQRERRPND